MMDEELPVILVKGRRGGAGNGVTIAVGAMLSPATARAAYSASLVQLVAEDLLRHLHLKLHESFRARRRSRSFLGKIGNVLTGADPDYIKISGSHLGQTLKLLGEDAADMLDAYETYFLRSGIARQAHDILGAQVGVTPDILARGLE